jgi:hypothetical protein
MCWWNMEQQWKLSGLWIMSCKYVHFHRMRREVCLGVLCMHVVWCWLQIGWMQLQWYQPWRMQCLWWKQPRVVFFQPRVVCHLDLPSKYVFNRLFFNLLHWMLGQFLLWFWSLYVHLQRRILLFR